MRNCLVADIAAVKGKEHDLLKLKFGLPWAIGFAIGFIAPLANSTPVGGKVAPLLFVLFNGLSIYLVHRYTLNIDGPALPCFPESDHGIEDLTEEQAARIEDLHVTENGAADPLANSPKVV